MQLCRVENQSSSMTKSKKVIIASTAYFLLEKEAAFIELLDAIK